MTIRGHESVSGADGLLLRFAHSATVLYYTDSHAHALHLGDYLAGENAVAIHVRRRDVEIREAQSYI